MPKVKKTPAEKSEYMKEAQRRRRAKIKQNVEQYAKAKERERQRYYRRKSEGKILPMSQVTSKQRDVIRKRNRDAFKAYYQRQKQKIVLETIEEVSIVKSEPEIVVKDVQDKERDPLMSSAEASRYKPRSAGREKAPKNKPSLSSLIKVEYISLTNGNTSYNVTKRPNDLYEETNAPQMTDHQRTSITQERATKRENIEEQIFTDISLNAELPASCSSTALPRLKRESSDSSIATSCTESIVQTPKPKRLTPMSKLMIKRIKYQANKEIHRLREKLYETNNENNKLRHQIYRMKNMRTSKDKKEKNSTKE